MTSTFAPLPETSTADLVADRLREAILDGTLQPGDRLVETELAERFAISRGPVREAIRLLAPEGLVILRRNRGAVVATPTFDDVLEVYAARLALGSVAIANAVRLHTAESSDFMRAVDLLAPLRDREVQADPMAMLEADLAFQSAVFATSGLPRIASMLEQSARDAASFVRLLGITYDSTDHFALIDRHQQLLDTIRGADVDLAIECWQRHIRATVSEFARGYADADGTGTSDHQYNADILGFDMELT